MNIATSKFLYRISTSNKVMGDDIFTNDLNSATLFCFECARDYGFAAVYNHQTGKLIQTIGQS